MQNATTYELADGTDRELASSVGAPRLPNAAAWLEELAALEAEFQTLLNRNSPHTEQAAEGRGEA